MTVEITKGLVENGWRQHSLFLGSDCPEVSVHVIDFQEDDIYIILPYSCAVVNGDFESKEPCVEVLRLRRAEKKNKGFLWGRNPRFLQIEIGCSDDSFYANALMHDRYFVPHELLTVFSPRAGMSMPDRHQETLKYWIAKRYTRNAFPSAFNSRSRGAIKNIESKLKVADFSDCILGVYLKIDPEGEELEQNEPYDIELLIIVSEKSRIVYADELSDFLDECEECLHECEGVVLSECSIKSESAIILSEYRELIRIDDYDFVSFRDDQDPAILLL